MNPQDIIGSKSFDFDVVSQSAAWIEAMNARENETGIKRSEADEYGISSFVYRARRPFHPARLMEFLNTAFVLDFDDDKQLDSEESFEDDDDEGLEEVSLLGGTSA